MPEYDSLPQDIAHRSRRSHVMAIIFGTIAAVVLVNLGAVIYLAYRPVNPADALVRRKWEILDRQTAPPVDWLILGDSTGNQNVVPTVIEAKLGGKALNLCVIADFLVLHDAWILNEYIHRVGVPKNVLLVHAYDVWRRPASEHLLAKLPRPWGFWNRLDPPQPVGRRGQKDIFLQRYAPLYSQTKSLGSLLRLRAQRGPAHDIGDDGLMKVTEPTPEATAQEAAEHIAYVTKHAFEISPPNRMALDRLVAMADSHGFHLYLVNAPIHEELWQNETFRRHFANMQAMLDETARRSPRVRVLFSTPVQARPEVLVGIDHLVVTEAGLYTERLAAEVAAARHGPR